MGVSLAPKLYIVPGTDGAIPDRGSHTSRKVRPIVDLPDLIVNPVEDRMACHNRVVAKLGNAGETDLRK